MMHEASRKSDGGNAPATKAKPPTVLVIDDNDVDRTRICELLRGAGFAVHDLASPIGATRRVRELEADILVIDQNLPAMDGSRLATLFRGSAAMRNVCVVLVSGADQSMHDLARQAGVDAFLTKSDLHDRLVPTIKRLLR